MTHSVPISSDLIDFDVPDDIGETEDRLRRDVAQWLQKNCRDGWHLQPHFRAETNGEKGEFTVLSFSVRFESERDAVQFKMTLV